MLTINICLITKGTFSFSRLESKFFLKLFSSYQSNIFFHSGNKLLLSQFFANLIKKIRERSQLCEASLQHCECVIIRQINLGERERESERKKERNAHVLQKNRTHTHTQARTLSISLFLFPSNPSTHSHTLSPSLSLSHTLRACNTPAALFIASPVCKNIILFLSLSLSLSHSISAHTGFCQS